MSKIESNTQKINQAQESWLQEQQSAYLYKIIASCSTQSSHQHLFAELANEALDQSTLWQNEVEKLGGKLPTHYVPSLRVRIVAWLIRRFGARSLRTILAAMKVRGMSIFSTEEVGHPMPQSMQDVGRSHKSINSGNNLRAAVFGINDGLISNASLIMGMAGGYLDSKVITLAGIAGLLAGAFSMAAGEYVSVRSQREMLEYQIAQEKKELELYPNEEAAELSLIYEARGLSKTAAEQMANTVMQDPVNALKTLAREELGLDPDNLFSPYSAAFFSFISFALGALLPLLPFLFKLGHYSVLFTVIITMLSLATVGATLSLYTGRSAIKSSLRMLLIGIAASGITYFIGHILGKIL